MTDQLEFVFEGEAKVKFDQYDNDNPHIYELFKRFAFEAIDSGREYFSAEAIINRVRWETMMSGNDEYKINNNYKPFYSRKFMKEYPQYGKFFRTRISKAD